MPHVLRKARIKQIHYGIRIHIPDQHEQIRILPGRLPGDGAGLQHELVGAERGVLEEHELVLVRGVQGPRGVLADGEVQRLEARRGGVGAVIAVDLELGAAEARLDVGCRGREDGGVREGYFYRESAVCCVEL